MTKNQNTVLIIDDDEDIRFVAGATMEDAGYAVLEAENGEEGLISIQENKPDLVLLDNNMPGMSGITMLRELRKTEKRIPVIMLTADSSQNVSVQAFRDGADDFLPKPFDNDFLVMVVRRAIDYRESRRKLRAVQIAQKASEEMHRMKDDFLAKLGHELKTPLHGFLSFGGLALKKIDAGKFDEARAMLVKFQENQDMFLCFVENIEQVAQLQTGQFVHQLVAGDLLVPIKLVQQQLEAQASLKQITLTLNTSETLLADFDVNAMQIALTHLLNNAIRFSPGNSVVSILGEQREGQVQISVMDEGIGIPLEEQSTVLQAFTESSRTASSAKGRGLGLAIVQGIVKLHNGNVLVNKRKDCSGTIITIVLPVSGVNHDVS